MQGTQFQMDVWQALKDIPLGTTCSYENIAQKIGKPKAVRAVASSIAKNKIAFLIPCHRVIRKSGVLGGYRWGCTIKKALLAWEAEVARFNHCA